MRRALLSSIGAIGLFATVPASAQDLQAPPPIQQGGPGSPVPNNEQLQKQETARRLDEAESEDSKRNFELVYVDAQAGGSYIDMAQFSSEDFAIRKTTSGGGAFSLGAGVRLLIFYAGARARYNLLSLFNLWQLNGEAGIKIPIGALDFMAGLHGGYSFVGSLADANKPSDDVSIRGFNLGLDVAMDYYLTSMFSVGAGLIGDLLVLNRPKVDLPANLTAEQRAAVEKDPLYRKSGSSAGLQLGAMLRFGVHFGL